MECTFAINSTAPGIVVIQDDQNIDNTTLVRNGDKGSVNITGLPAGEYNVSVYDKYGRQQSCISALCIVANCSTIADHLHILDLLLS